MNTKQLWCALSLNAKTSYFFDGIYSKDTLNDYEMKEKPGFIICNTDPSDKLGEHWVVFFCNENGSVDFYDSLGRDITYYGTEIYNFVTKKISNGWYYCKERTQPIGTSLCGEYCMYYVLMKCIGYEMSKIIKSMNPENVLLVVQRTFYDGFTYKCPLLQNCVKC